MNPFLPYLIGKIKALNNQSNITIVCIDGPTAAGKTILANNLGKEISQCLGINVEFFRLDWTLKNRLERQKDLQNLLQNNDDFQLEGEMHMQLDIFKNFLEKVNELKYDQLGDFYQNKFVIEGLYSRDDDGECVGKNKYDFSKKTVLICEGHYTSRSEYRNLIDLNICLLSDKKELLHRKVNRVKGYRSSQDAIDYFWKIDVPSFSYHLKRYFHEIDLLIDNTDYINPKVSELCNFKEWITSDLVSEKAEELSTINNTKYINIFYKIFSRSQLNQTINVNQFTKIIDFHKRIDFQIAARLQESINSKTLGVKESLNNELKKLESALNIDGCEIKVESKSSNSLYDVYYRKIPVSYGICIEQKNKKKIYLNYSIFMYKCEILLFWAGGAYEFIFNRPLTSIKDNNEVNSVNFKCISNNLRNLNNLDIEKFKLKLFAPTDFCVPEFIKDFQYELIYTGREHEITSLNEIIKSLFNSRNSILCHRLSNYSEIEFFTKLLNSIGISVLNVGNYLIALNTISKSIKENYILWVRQWVNTRQNCKTDQKNYDDSVKKELEDAEKSLRSFSKHFFFVDSFLFESGSNNSVDEKIEELRRMLNSSNRSLRKRAFQYIEKDAPSLQIKIKDFLSLYGIEYGNLEKDSFPLSQIALFYPSIMAEIYLWIKLKGDKSALLGANVYDLDSSESIDIDGIMESSVNRNVPVIFQSSFNAIGQYEKENNKEYFGYLKLENGPLKLVNSCIISSLKSYFLEGSNFPFYGIGLDHVDSKNDTLQSGRASRFIDLAIKTGYITHIVLDGSSLFNSKSRSFQDLSEAYNKVAEYEVSLIKKNPSIFLIDLEYCVGEMNYIGDSNLAMIPSRDEIKLFVEILQNKLSNSGIGKYNCRPSLFIGNVGTTHHFDDSSNIDSSITYSWVEHVKRSNFISAVLHGTTNSEVSVLKKSTYGCHKVNVAGDFLKVYVSSLPDRFSNDLRNFSPNSKYYMKEISQLKSSLSNKEISTIRKNICKKSTSLIDTIKSPHLTNRDKSYFHRFSYKFEDDALDLILNTYKEYKKSTNIKKNKFLKKKLYFSASMIEVPYEGSFCEIADNLIKEGIKYFHIDVGDGIFISRKFSGLNKLGYLSSLNKDIKIHTHLMVKDPFLKLSNNKSYIDSYIEAGSSSIALHARSFDSKMELKKAMQYIKAKDCRPGLLIEINNTDLTELWNLVKYLEISWVVIMGVPIGYGGQLFQSNCLRTIQHLRTMSFNEGSDQFDIEVDGGLNFNNINLCVDAGANIFSGWSIIKDISTDLIIKNYKKLIKQLSN